MTAPRRQLGGLSLIFPCHLPEYTSYFPAIKRGVLLLFLRGRSFETVQLPGGTIPPHDGNGPVHIAFSVAANELAAWEQRLKAEDIAIEGRTKWPRGGESIFTLSPLQRFAVGVGDDHLFGEWRVTRYDVRAILGDGDGNLLLG